MQEVQSVLNDVRSRIDQVSSFLPPRAEDPDVRQICFALRPLRLASAAQRDRSQDDLEADLQLREIAEEIRAELLELRAVKPTSSGKIFVAPQNAGGACINPKGPAITSAEIAAERPYEISVEVSEDALRQYGLSLQTTVADYSAAKY